MKPIESSGSTVNGIAKIELHPKEPKVKITFKPEEGEKPKSYVVEKENCPDYIRNGTFMVSMAENGKKVYGVRPINAVVKLKFKEFPAKKDSEPAPKTHNGKFGAYQTFSAVFEIVDGEFKGMEVPGSFPYDFVMTEEEIQGKMHEVINAKKKKDSKNNDRLWDFLQVTGLATKTMPWKENVLPTLQKYILRDGKVFSGAIREGWIDSLYSEEAVAF